MKEHVVRKMGGLIPTEVLSRLHIINDMPVSEDLKRGRFGDALKDLGSEKAQILRLLIAFLSEYGPFETGVIAVVSLPVLMICRCHKKRLTEWRLCWWKNPLPEILSRSSNVWSTDYQ